MRRFPQYLACLSAALLLQALAADAQQRPAGSPLPAENPPVQRYRVEIILFANTDCNPLEEQFENDYDGPKGSSLADRPVPVPIVPLPGRNDPAAVLAIEPFGGRPGEPTDIQAPGQSPDSTGAARIDAGGFEPITEDPFEFVDPFGRLATAAPGARNAATPSLPPGFRLLRADEYSLDDAERVIDRLGAYRPLGHAGWVQEGLDEANAVPLDIAYLGIANPRGSLKLYLGRFLHMAVDLEYDRELGTAGAGAFSTGLGEIERAHTYRLKSERNAFRSGELHYIDHPLFGMLMLVTPVPEEDGTDETATGVEPAA